jgi:hypothetical protein
LNISEQIKPACDNMKEGKNIWDVFQEETGINYYFFEVIKDKNHYRIIEPSVIIDAISGKSSYDPPVKSIDGLFVCKTRLFDESGKYIGKPFFPFVDDMLAFERDNKGEFLTFPSIVLDHHFRGETTNWYDQFKKDFFPFD